MGSQFNNPRMVLTHLPTGITVEVNQFRTHQQGYAQALKLLQAKLFAIKYELYASNKPFNYILPNDVTWPNELLPFRNLNKRK